MTDTIQAPLPPGWVWATLNDIADRRPASITDGPFGSKLKSEHYTLEGPRVVRLQNIGEGNFIDEKAHISREHFETLRRHEVSSGDLLIAVLGETLPRACIAPPSLGEAIVKADCIRVRVRAEVASATYVMYVLNCEQTRKQASSIIHGVGRPRLNLGELKAIRFPLAPRPEQDRIVAAIEQHLSDIDAGVAALERVQANLKRYRASVLKAACEGRLVPTEAELARKEGRAYEPASELLNRILAERRARWEEDQLAKMKAKGQVPRDEQWRAKYTDPRGLSSGKTSDIPNGWSRVRLNQIADVQLGQQRAPVHAAASETLPYIRAANITWDGLNLADVKRMGFPNPERYTLENGDILLSEASGSASEVGKPAIWKGQIANCCYQKTLLRVRSFSREITPGWLHLTFLADALLGRFAQMAPGVGILHLTAERMLEWPVLIPPVNEQCRIVAEVRRLLSINDQVENTTAVQLAKAESLRQAVLQKGFQGSLVSQGRDEEVLASRLSRLVDDEKLSMGKTNTAESALTIPSQAAKVRVLSANKSFGDVIQALLAAEKMTAPKFAAHFEIAVEAVPALAALTVAFKPTAANAMRQALQTAHPSIDAGAAKMIVDALLMAARTATSDAGEEVKLAAREMM